MAWNDGAAVIGGHVVVLSVFHFSFNCLLGWCRSVTSHCATPTGLLVSDCGHRLADHFVGDGVGNGTVAT